MPAKADAKRQPAEWTGGDHFWLIDIVGEPRALGPALRTLAEGPFKAREVHVVLREANGAARISTLADLQALAGRQSTPEAAR